MRKSLGKVIALALAATVVSSSLFAQDNRKRYRDHKNEQNQGHAEGTQQLNGGYNAPARYEVQESWDTFVYGQFLYMQATQENMVYAVTSTDSQRGNPPVGGKAVSSDFHWHPGVIVGLGFGTDFDDWTINTEWMHYISKNDGTVSKPAGGSMLQPDSVIFSGTTIVDDARNTWSLTFNRVDLLLGRPAYVGKNLIIDGFFGLRGAWISQNIDTEYTGVTNSAGGQNKTQVNSKFGNWGLGARTALNTKWLVGYGLNVFAKGGASILGTRFHTRKEIVNPDLAEDMTGRNVNNYVFQVSQPNNLQIRPNADLGLGLGWGSYFDDDNWHVDISVGYDYHYWWGQNNNVQSLDDFQKGTFLQDGDLQIHGGNFTLRFDF